MSAAPTNPNADPLAGPTTVSGPGAPPQPPPPPTVRAAADPGTDGKKLAIEKFADASITCLKFSGTIDEQFSGKAVAATVKPGTLILDLGDVTKISSFGIREWVDFMNQIGQKVDQLFLIELAPKIVDQLNMVANFAGKGRVVSFYAPYRCDYCDDDRRRLLQFETDFEAIKNMKPPVRPCEACGNPEYFDEDPTSFFSFLAQQPKFELDPAVATFLSAKMNYAVAEGRKIKIEKQIEGRATFVKLVGDLDGSFPRDKLAEGLEGDVIFDLTSVGKIDPAGAAEWRQLMGVIRAATDRIFLVGCPPVFIERLTQEEDLGGKAQVLSFAMPYTCSKCATTASQVVDVEQHFDVLKFATPPELKCLDCGGDTACAASDALLAHLATLPKPAPDAAVRKFIKAAQERKPDKPKAATDVAAAQSRSQSLMMALVGLAALIVISIAAVAIVIGMRGPRPGLEDIIDLKKAQVVEMSTDKTPSWVDKTVERTGGNVLFVGRSSYVAERQAGFEEAENAAIENIAQQISTMLVRNGKWLDHVQPQFRQHRDQAMGALERIVTAERPDPAQLDAAKKAVRDGRRRVASTFKRTASALLPAQKADYYWQKFSTTAGIRYRVAVLYSIPNAIFEKMIDSYVAQADEMGVSVVPYFPSLGWRYDLEEGAIVTSLKPDSPMRLVGIAPGDIITAVDDIPIKDANTFQKTVQVRFQIACKDGADMVWKAKRGDGPIVDMRARIPAGCGKVAERPKWTPPPGWRPPTGPTKKSDSRNRWDIDSKDIRE
jgi:anti-anti-sigma regulatory factor